MSSFPLIFGIISYTAFADGYCSSVELDVILVTLFEVLSLLSNSVLIAFSVGIEVSAPGLPTDVTITPDPKLLVAIFEIVLLVAFIVLFVNVCVPAVVTIFVVPLVIALLTAFSVGIEVSAPGLPTDVTITPDPKLLVAIFEIVLLVAFIVLFVNVCVPAVVTIFAVPLVIALLTAFSVGIEVSAPGLPTDVTITPDPKLLVAIFEIVLLVAFIVLFVNVCVPAVVTIFAVPLVIALVIAFCVIVPSSEFPVELYNFIVPGIVPSTVTADKLIAPSL